MPRPLPGRCRPCWWPLPTRMPSAWFPCRRPCWALPSTSASCWRSLPCRAGGPPRAGGGGGGPRSWGWGPTPPTRGGGGVPAVAWWLWLGTMFWVLAYDTEYAMVDRDDDLKIGIKTSAITLGRLDVAAIMLCYLLFLSLWVWALHSRALGALFYVAIAAALAQALWHWRLIRQRTRAGCFAAFRVNHWLGCTVFAGIAGSYLVRHLQSNG